MSVSTHEHEFVVAERDALRREVVDAMESYATQAAEMQDAWRRNEELLAQLAASQAREQQFRDLLSNCVIPFANSTMVTIAKWRVEEAFSTPNDTTALSAVVAKAGEVMRERCFAIGHSASIDDSIRALPDVTLEDLK